MSVESWLADEGARRNARLLEELLPLLDYDQLVALGERLPPDASEGFWVGMLSRYNPSLHSYFVVNARGQSAREFYLDVLYQEKYPSDLSETPTLQQPFGGLQGLPSEMISRISAGLSFKTLRSFCRTYRELNDQCRTFLYREHYARAYPDSYRLTTAYRSPSADFEHILTQLEEYLSDDFEDFSGDPDPYDHVSLFRPHNRPDHVLLYLCNEREVYPEVLDVLFGLKRPSHTDYITTMLDNKLPPLNLFQYMLDTGRVQTSFVDKILQDLDRYGAATHIEAVLDNLEMLRELKHPQAVEVLLKYAHVDQMDVWLSLRAKDSLAGVYTEEVKVTTLLSALRGTPEMTPERARVFADFYDALAPYTLGSNRKLLRGIHQLAKRAPGDARRTYRDLLNHLLADYKIPSLMKSTYAL